MDDGGVEAGQIIAGRYRLIDEVGRGGVGVVYRAQDSQTGQELAIKIIVPVDSAGNTSNTKVGRFLREARAMRRLRSPHVVQVFDHGSCIAADGDEELIYLTMELLVGEALRDRVRRETTLSPEVTMRVMSQVGRAVGLAHQRNILHRDIKPANIFLCDRRDDEFIAKVLDFGMAKSLAIPLASVDPVHTEHGRPIGTPYYMSPEQARGLALVDHRTDLWAMGVIAYECLLGKRPFIGKSLVRVFASIAAGAIPIPSEHGDVPVGFDGWFAHAVERDVQKRFQSAKLMIEELQEVLVGPVSISQTSTGELTGTLNDVLQTTMEKTAFSARTLRKGPEASLGNSFVGRRDLLETMDQAVKNHCRVLTLVGEPGSGRSRLAHEFGRIQGESYPAGVWCCSLANATDAASMWQSIALTLGAQLDDNVPGKRTGRALHSAGRIVLLLSSVAAVREILARTISEWLRVAPRAIFVVTSDKPLAVPTERVVQVATLGVPPYGEELTWDRVKAFPSGELFLKRALGFKRAVMTEPDAAKSVGTIAQLAGGNPLALELLAGVLLKHSVGEVAERVGQTLVQLGGTAVIAPSAVAEQSIAWVVSQHDAQERATLAQLSSFVGGCTLPAAEAVVDLSRWPDAPTVSEMMDRMLKRGLLRIHEPTSGDTRYEMHPAVRRHCSVVPGQEPAGPEVADDAARAEERHGHYFAQLGSSEALDALELRGGWARRSRYVHDAPNATLALARAAARRDGIVVAACSLVVATVLEMVGHHGAAASTLVRAVSIAETPEPMRLRCLIAQGRALTRAGRFDAARSALERARSTLAQGERPLLLARCMRILGRLYLIQGHMQYAHAELASAQQQSLRCGDRLGEARASVTLAEIQRRNGDLAGAVHTLHQARVACHDLGAHRLYATTLEALGSVHIEQGRHDGAHGAFEAALSLHRELGDRMAEARVLGALGEHALEAGQFFEAEALLEQAEGRASELGALETEGRALGALASCYANQGKTDRAWRTWQRGHTTLNDVNTEASRRQLAALLCRRAHFEIRRNARAAAHRTLHEIEEVLTALNAPPPPELGRQVAMVRHTLGVSVPASMV